MKPIRLIISLVICLAGMTMTSCFHTVDYRYAISNKSSETITLEFLPQDWSEWVIERGDLPWWHYMTVYLLGEGYEKIDYYTSPFELKPGESLMFSWVYEDYAAPKEAENPLWKKDHMIGRILIGDNPVDATKEIPESYWSDRANWQMREKESDYVEYWLDIDDEVIREQATILQEK